MMAARWLLSACALLLAGCFRSATEGEESNTTLPEEEITLEELQSLRRLPEHSPVVVGPYEVRLFDLRVSDRQVEARLFVRRLSEEEARYEEAFNPFFLSISRDRGFAWMLVLYDPVRRAFSALRAGEVDGEANRMAGVTGTEAVGWERTMHLRFSVPANRVPAYLRLVSIRSGVSLLFPLLSISYPTPLALIPLHVALPGMEGRLPETAFPAGRPATIAGGPEITIRGFELSSRSLRLQSGGEIGPGSGSLWAIVRGQARCLAARCEAGIGLQRIDGYSPLEFVGPEPYRNSHTLELSAGEALLELVFYVPRAPWRGGWLIVFSPEGRFFFALPAPEQT
nr:MAG: hypothetical protein KatS3mg041_1098 [Bacteroidota bacterium]